MCIHIYIYIYIYIYVGGERERERAIIYIYIYICMYMCLCYTPLVLQVARQVELHGLPGPPHRGLVNLFVLSQRVGVDLTVHEPL